MKQWRDYGGWQPVNKAIFLGDVAIGGHPQTPMIIDGYESGPKY